MPYIDASGAITDDEIRRSLRSAVARRPRNYIDQARQDMQAQLSRSSYFPAANLRQFEGTELAPPGGGTYYNPARYAGAPASVQRTAQRNLARAWQQDLAFNVQANPQMAAGLQAERIGAQRGGGGTFAGRQGYQAMSTPSGGSAVVSNRVAGRMMARGGGYNPEVSSGLSQSDAYQVGYGGQPGFVNQPASQQTPYQRSYSMGYNIGGVQRPEGGGLGYMAGAALAGLAGNAYNAVANLFRGNQQPPAQRPESQSYVNREPRRYFDY